jgi:hypothetical protein
MIAKHPWVRIARDSCDTITELNLRVKRCDPDASIRVVLRDVRCLRYFPRAPLRSGHTHKLICLVRKAMARQIERRTSPVPPGRARPHGILSPLERIKLGLREIVFHAAAAAPPGGSEVPIAVGCLANSQRTRWIQITCHCNKRSAL